MIAVGLLADTITVYPVTQGDDKGYGSHSKTKGSAVILRAQVEPVSVKEDESGRDTFTTEYVAFTLPSAALTGTSEVVWDGDSYEVVGEPKQFNSLLGGPHHFETLIRRVEG
jgi:hypothetical protein